MKRLLSSLVLGCLALSMSSVSIASAADEPAAKTAEKKVDKKSPKNADEAGRRLPAYYKQVVDDAQRDKIYGIQAEYAPQLKALKTQMSALEAKRDAAIKDVLTADQQKKVDALAAEAKNKKGANKPGEKPAGKAAEKTEARPAAKTSPKVENEPATTTKKPAATIGK